MNWKGRTYYWDNNSGRDIKENEWVLFYDNQKSGFLMLRNSEKYKNKLQKLVIDCWCRYVNTLFLTVEMVNFVANRRNFGNNPLTAQKLYKQYYLFLLHELTYHSKLKYDLSLFIFHCVKFCSFFSSNTWLQVKIFIAAFDASTKYGAAYWKESIFKSAGKWISLKFWQVVKNGLCKEVQWTHIFREPLHYFSSAFCLLLLGTFCPALLFASINWELFSNMTALSFSTE